MGFHAIFGKAEDWQNQSRIEGSMCKHDALHIPCPHVADHGQYFGQLRITAKQSLDSLDDVKTSAR